jgi:hypothetical protein
MREARELFEDYVDTVERCTSDVLTLSEEDLLCNLFEEFATSVWSFFHEDNLKILRDAGLIDDDMVALSKEVRTRWLALEAFYENRPCTIEEIKSKAEWQELFRLCDQLKLKLKCRHQ